MESEDDADIFSPPNEENPSPVNPRTFKRLKKAIRVSPTKAPLQSPRVVDSVDPIESFRDSDPPAVEKLSFDYSGESGLSVKRVLDVNRELLDGSEEPSRSGSDDVEEERKDFDDESVENNVGVKRTLDFEEADNSEDMLGGFEGVVNKKKRSKRAKKNDGGDNPKEKEKAPNKRREEKERREYLKHLHAESQRLLRETRDAGFKHLPLVEKPISSILEKIRQRKLEMSKKFVSLRNSSPVHGDDHSYARDEVNPDSETFHLDKSEDDKSVEVISEKTSLLPAYTANVLNLSPVEGNSEVLKDGNDAGISTPQGMDENSKPAFRAPIDDTQNLFSDSQTSDSNGELPSEENEGPLEETFTPSLLAMQLKFDSAPPDDLSSDEEDNDKENITPHLYGLGNESASPNGDPVKAFVDEEAEVEDDSDNDQLRFPENEDEDIDDAEELNDMIATAYEEKQIDHERRRELHMKMLEQQDAAGVENLLQRLGCGTKQSETTLLDEEEEREEDGEFSDEDSEDIAPKSSARINFKKLKEMIPQMFTDKDDVYLSSDDEETEQIIKKQRILQKAGKVSTFVSPLEDENSREMSGLIKKLNIVQDVKKKAKSSSSASILTAREIISYKKSSFVGRSSNTNGTLPSSKKHGSSNSRSFIFGRDDSNSRSSISVSEDSLDTVQKEVRPTRSTVNKFSSSQTKSYNNTQSTHNTAEKTSNTSLFEILRKPVIGHREEVVAQSSQSSIFSAFKLPKRPLKMDRNR